MTQSYLKLLIAAPTTTISDRQTLEVTGNNKNQIPLENINCKLQVLQEAVDNILPKQTNVTSTTRNQGTKTTTNIWMEEIIQLSVIILLLSNLLVEFR